jgi:hypothetical protein
MMSLASREKRAAAIKRMAYVVFENLAVTGTSP